MKIDVLLFAAARDLAGTSSLELLLPNQVTVGDLRKQMALRFPQLESLLRKSAIAVDERYAGDEELIREGAEVGLIPPVSGG